jgi:hypothetical protein
VVVLLLLLSFAGTMEKGEGKNKQGARKVRLSQYRSIRALQILSDSLVPAGRLGHAQDEGLEYFSHVPPCPSMLHGR